MLSFPLPDGLAVWWSEWSFLRCGRASPREKRTHARLRNGNGGGDELSTVRILRSNTIGHRAKRHEQREIYRGRGSNNKKINCYNYDCVGPAEHKMGSVGFWALLFIYCNGVGSGATLLGSDPRRLRPTGRAMVPPFPWDCFRKCVYAAGTTVRGKNNKRTP